MKILIRAVLVRTTAQLVLLAMFVVTTLAMAADQKYPPYPEAWGYELPFSSADQRHIISGYRRTPTGDIRISYRLANTPRPEESRQSPAQKKMVGVVYFFSGERRFLTGPEADAERQKPSPLDRPIRSIVEKIAFNDGTTVRVKVVFDEAFDRKCFISHPYSLQALDRNGQVVANKSIVYVHDRPLVRLSLEICNGGQKNKVLERSTTDGISLIPLEDETFLIRVDGHYILRFDKELHTKYSPRGPLYILDTDVIEGIRAKHEALPWPLKEQTVNDEVTNYVLKMPKGATK